MIRGKTNREADLKPSCEKNKIMSVNNPLDDQKREHNYPGQNQSGRHVRTEDDSRSPLDRPSR